MKPETLDKVVTRLIYDISKMKDIDNIEKVELMINLKHFLESTKYEENISKLRRK